MKTWLQFTAEAMLADLEQHRLEVVLVPAKRGDGMVRCVQDENPEWYRKLCARFSCQRKTDTTIKRQPVVRTLQLFAAGQNPTTLYGQRLLPYLCNEWTQLHEGACEAQQSA